MSFHLAKLRNLIRDLPDGNYGLTDDGREALWSVETISGTKKAERNELRVRRAGMNLRRAVLVSLITAVLVIGSVSLIQQQQLAMQEGQIAAEQQQIALYVKQIQPFANAQAASMVLGQKDFATYVSAAQNQNSNPRLLGYNPTSSGLNYPTQALFDPFGNLWVADSLNNRIIQFKAPFTSGMSASLVIGQKNLTSIFVKSPLRGAIFGAVSNNVLGGPFSSGWGVSGLAFDGSGDLWVTDPSSHRILEFVPPFADGVSASLVLGQRNFTTYVTSTTKSGLSLPSRVAFDPSGNLWVLDSGNDRVLQFKPPFSDGMDASLVIGQKDFASSSVATTQSGLNCVFGDLALDSSGNLWVGDVRNNRILEFRPPFSMGMGASLVLGQPDFTTSALQATLPPVIIGINEGSYNLGFALAFDPSGDLWATFSNRVLEFRPPFATSMQPSLEIGQPDFTSNAWVGGASGLSVPNHPAFDSQGSLWVPDSGSNRILRFGTAYPTSNSITSQQVFSSGGIQQLLLGESILVAGVALSAAVLRKRGLI